MVDAILLAPALVGVLSLGADQSLRRTFTFGDMRDVTAVLVDLPVEMPADPVDGGASWPGVSSAAPQGSGAAR